MAWRGAGWLTLGALAAGGAAAAAFAFYAGYRHRADRDGQQRCVRVARALDTAESAAAAISPSAAPSGNGGAHVLAPSRSLPNGIGATATTTTTLPPSRSLLNGIGAIATTTSSTAGGAVCKPAPSVESHGAMAAHHHQAADHSASVSAERRAQHGGGGGGRRALDRDRRVNEWMAESEAEAALRRHRALAPNYAEPVDIGAIVNCIVQFAPLIRDCIVDRWRQWKARRRERRNAGAATAASNHDSSSHTSTSRTAVATSATASRTIDSTQTGASMTQTGVSTTQLHTSAAVLSTTTALPADAPPASADANATRTTAAETLTVVEPSGQVITRQRAVRNTTPRE